MKNLTFSKISMSLTALALLAVFSWAGCGGGGGGSSSSDPTSNGTTTITGTVYPAVVLKSTDGSSGAVDTAAAISITFSKDMDATTINTSTFILYQGTVYLGCGGASTSTGTSYITGAVTYDAAAKKATFTPVSSLSYNTTYNAQVGCVKDTSGNAIANSFTWSFTTKDITPATPYLMGGAIQGNPLNPNTNVVTTLAGLAGNPGSTDGTGSSARFYFNFYQGGSITTDGTNLYVTDTFNHTIRKIVISTGVVTTIAGTAGSSGSADGTGAAARFSYPNGITTDGTNLYVADSSNNSIRKIVISTGAVITIAGSAGLPGSTDGTGSSARFYFGSYLGGITTDGTNLYVTDSNNHTIRKIVISTGAVTTVAGSAGLPGSTDGTGSAARFNDPAGITTDGTNLYVTDSNNHTIRKIVISTGVVTTLAGTAGSSGSTDGTGSAASFKYPTGITTDGTNLYVANSTYIRKVVISTGVVSTIAGSYYFGSTDGTGSAASFYYPAGITTDGTNLYVEDTNNNTIRKISASTTAPSSAPTNVTATAGNGQITITWDSVSGATCYNLYCAEGTSVITTTGPKIPYIASPYQLGGYWTATPITNGTTYSCIVTAVNDYGEGPASTQTSSTPAASHTLSVSKSGTGSGTVTSSPSGLSCGSTCTASVTTDTTVTLTATAASGSTFSGWSGACSGTGSCVVTMSSDKSVTATFTTSTSSSTYYWANWSCGSSSQCASIMGGYTGSTGQFCTLKDCNSWLNIYIPNNLSSCSTTATYTKHTGTYSNGVCGQSGVDF